MKIYLSGGMKTGWQDRVISGTDGGDSFLDPRSHGLVVPDEYVKRDLEMVLESEAVLAFMEEVNPSGIGMSVEIGFAKAHGKKIWFICEKKEKHWDFIKALADENFDSIEEYLDWGNA